MKVTEDALGKEYEDDLQEQIWESSVLVRKAVCKAATGSWRHASLPLSQWN